MDVDGFDAASSFGDRLRPRSVRILCPGRTRAAGLVAPQLDAAALDEIAMADYGAHVQEYRRELTELVHSPWLPDELTWNPGEVLALTRRTRPARRRDHIQRLFACTFLVRAVTDGGNPVDSAGPLVDSAWELGEPARGLAVRFLAWCRLNLPGDWRDDPSSVMFLTLAVLLLSAETAVSAALAAILVEELDVVLGDPELPWRRRPGSPLFHPPPQRRRRHPPAVVSPRDPLPGGQPRSRRSPADRAG